MIEFLVRGRVRIKIRIRVRVTVRVGLCLILAFMMGAIVAGANVVQSPRHPAKKEEKTEFHIQ